MMEKSLFSILIPSWNNLPFLKLCVESLRKNSTYNHQIIAHVNDGSDGTLEWVKSNGIDYTYSEHNVGVCIAMNMMRAKVQTDYIVFLNDDMYVLPEWDKVLYDEILSLPDNRFFLSATTIQRHQGSGSFIQADYGDQPDNFREVELLRNFKNRHTDWDGGASRPRRAASPTGITRCQRVAAMDYRTMITVPPERYSPSVRAEKRRLRSPSALTNRIEAMPLGFADHEIRQVFRVMVRSPSLTWIVPAANLSVLSPFVKDETSGNAPVRDERSMVEPFCIVQP